MPPLILAAKAIPNNLDAEELYEYSIEIIKGLICKGVQCISYACDGTETEHSVQCLLKSGAETLFTYSIKHPNPRFPDIVITIAMIDGQLVAIIQDSKHGLKTARNNFFSGTKLLTMGNHIVMYSYARDLAFGPGSPLYHRDVEKTDRQDDSIALQLSLASTMVYLTKQYPDHLGVVAYLFTFGELIDAYQNRRISHGERIKMVLRARFFIDMWRSFLKSVGYPLATLRVSSTSLGNSTTSAIYWLKVLSLSWSSIAIIWTWMKSWTTTVIPSYHGSTQVRLASMSLVNVGS